MAYQQRWVADRSPLKVMEKSRRTGITWGEASDNVLTAASQRTAGGQNVYYIAYNQDMTIEYIQACAMWARVFNYVAGEIEEGIYTFPGIKEAAVVGEPDERRGERPIAFIAADDPAAFDDQALLDFLKERLAEVMLTKTRDEWCVLMEHTDVCFAPVLTMSEAAAHPHNVARGTFVEVAGATQPAPAPRFSRTAAHIDSPPAHPGQHSREVLADWGFSGERIESLVAGGAVASS